MHRPTDTDNDIAHRVLETASRLFYAHGVRAVGVEWIVSESGVAKTSLYRHFETKDDLVAAFLEREDAQFWRQWDEALRPAAGDPRRELEALLDWIGLRVSRDGYRGCPQINVAAEFSDSEHPARRIRKRHKAHMLERLERLVARTGAERADEVALQLALLFDGAFTSDGRLNRANAGRVLRSAADALLRATTVPSGPTEASAAH